MKPYGGPLSFRTTSLESQGEKLDRAFAELDRCIRDVTRGVTRRWETIETVRGSTDPARTIVAKPGVLFECDTEDATGASPGPTVIFTLPPVSRADAGLETGIIRVHEGGTISLFPIDGATLDGSVDPQTLSTDRGCYVLVITPRGYWLRR